MVGVEFGLDGGRVADSDFDGRIVLGARPRIGQYRSDFGLVAKPNGACNRENRRDFGGLRLLLHADLGAGSVLYQAIFAR